MTTNRINFTKAVLDGLSASPEGRLTYLDCKTAGLQLRVSPKGVKTFSVFRRIKGGHPERITIGRYPETTIEQARRGAAKVNAAIADSQNPAEVRRTLKGEPTFADLFAQYMDRHSRPRKRTWREDEGKYRLYLSRPLGPKKASQVTRSDVAGIHASISRCGHPTTANRVLALLSSVYSWGASAGLVQINPAKGVRRNPERSRDRFLHASELPRFFRALAGEPNPAMRDFFLVCLLTGARRENVLSMRWEDISFDRAEWRIPRTKNGDPQIVALCKPALELLQNKRTGDASRGFVFPSRGNTGHITETRRAWERLFDRDEIAELQARIQEHGHSFSPPSGMTTIALLKHAREHAQELGVDITGARLMDLRVHDLRRTLGSWQAMLGASLAVIGKSLNHKSVNATLVYARLETDPVRDSVERAAAALLNAAENTPVSWRDSKRVAA